MRGFKRVMLGAVCAGLCVQAASAASSYAYLSAGNGTFGVVDLNSGVFTPCGAQGGQTYTGPGIGADGVLYAGVALGNGFGTIDKSTGAFSQIGNSNVTFLGIGSLRNRIYAVQYNSAGGIDLYGIDQKTGIGRYIGNTGVAEGGNNWPGLSSGADALYFYFAPNLPRQGGLYKLNVLTGEARLIKKTSIRTAGPMAEVNGVLYAGVQDLPLRIVSYDKQTRQFVRVSTVNPSEHYLWGLAPATGVTCK